MIFRVSGAAIGIMLARISLAAVFLTVLSACEEGDPTALKQAVKAADLNISSITVNPADGAITTGYSYQFSATGHRDDGSSVDISTSVTWSTSNSTIATVNTAGRVTTTNDGSVTVTASLASLVGSTSLTASSAPLQDITVLADTATPTNLSVSACRNLQLKAIGTYADGVRDVIPITEHVTWSIDNGNGVISSQGLLSTRSEGNIGVQASLDMVNSAVTNVDAVADLGAINIAPLTRTILLNETLQYSASGVYNDSSTADITANVLWMSSATQIANFVSPAVNGLITAINLGGTTVSATCGAIVSGNASLTVSEDVLDYLRFENALSNEISSLTISVGEISNLKLRAYFTSGTDDDVTEDAEWSLADGSPVGIITVSNTSGSKGRITALSAGQVYVKAVYKKQEKVLPVTVN